jgi:hypothetical protein
MLYINLYRSPLTLLLGKKNLAVQPKPSAKRYSRQSSSSLPCAIPRKDLPENSLVENSILSLEKRIQKVEVKENLEKGDDFNN